MKNDMKLIMESFKKNTLKENMDPKTLGAKLEDELEDVFDNAIKDLTKQIEDKKDLNEIVGTASLIFAIWKLTLATAGLGALLSKFGKMLIVGRSADTGLMEKYEGFFEGVFETVATMGTKGPAKYLVKIYNLGRGRTLEETEDILEQVDNIYKIIAVVIGLAVSGTELYKAAEQSGGIGNFIKDLYSKAGISDAKALQGTVDAFSTTVGTGGDAFDAGSFIAKMTRTVRNLLQGT